MFFAELLSYLFFDCDYDTQSTSQKHVYTSALRKAGLYLGSADWFVSFISSSAAAVGLEVPGFAAVLNRPCGVFGEASDDGGLNLRGGFR